MKKLNLSYAVFIASLLIATGLIITAFVDISTSAIALAYIGLFLLPVLFVLILIDRMFNTECKKNYFNWSLLLILSMGAIAIYIYYIFSDMNFLI